MLIKTKKQAYSWHTAESSRWCFPVGRKQMDIQHGTGHFHGSSL